MPELPEVQTVVNGLNATIIGKQIVRVEHDWERCFPNAKTEVQAHLIGARITAVSRRAKVIRIDLDNGWALLVHLMMTGQLVYNLEIFPDSTTRVILDFSDGTKLFFNDQRKFGWMLLLEQSAIAQHRLIRRLGPEPLSDEFDWNVLKTNSLRHRKSTIKATLLNQSVLAGMGNIYTDEVLFLSRIRPERLTESLSDADFKRLCGHIKAVLQHSIDLGGSSRQNYLMVDGSKGDYLDDPWVYGRAGEACKHCGSLIEKSRVAQRGTHTCPKCQK